MRYVSGLQNAAGRLGSAGRGLLNSLFVFKRRLLALYIGLALIFILACVMKGYLSDWERNLVFIYYNGCIQSERLIRYARYAQIASAGFLGLVILRYRPVRFAVFGLCTAFFLLFAAVDTNSFWNPAETYYTLRAPDRSRSFIVREGSWLLGSWCDFYQQTGPCTVRMIGSLSMDDGYCPYGEQDYTIQWPERSFHIRYGNGQGGMNEETILFDSQ